MENEVNKGDVPKAVEISPDDHVFTRLMEKGPFYPPQIKAIVEKVTYGLLPPDKLQWVKDKIGEFADTFILSVREVKPVDFMKFRLNLGALPQWHVEYPMKVNQKPLMQAQKEWYLPVLDEFNKAGVMRDICSDEVKAMHPTVLAQKAHGVLGLMIEEIQWMLEDQCIVHGKPPNPNLLPWPQSEMDAPSEVTPAKLKW
ncbi:hypothetical protein PAXRUDRAFT_153947 [Paxillus rubicundulus Ve08.2h10]|uniref:Uncharacterized protein n=1 Tax=Paxillus rubicundulus Ve08.2h10 TaxID=930991 RepID=A0A0D0DRI2_9AGAM|nr:hypothetical protein PAXRUDRAFT_153947 [Paxillus rubicundulus Ve08.2h10]